MSAASEALTVWQRRIVWACWLAGGLGRLIYLTVLHPATAHVYSDMQGYVFRAERYFTPAPENIADTLYPPGTSILFGALYRLDPSWMLCILAQWLLSLGVMGLIWLLARRLYGTATAVVALAFAALYFPFVHYAALFLAENPFTFCGLLALWLYTAAIEAESSTQALVWAVLAGLAAAAAASFKNTILAPMVVLAAVYAIWAIRQRALRPHVLPLALGVALGLALLLLPLSERCTRLAEDRFCPVATNGAMNLLMGHYGEKGPFYWHDRARNIEYSFQSPTASLRGYTERVDLDFGVYDTDANLALARQWIAEHPREALRLSFLHVYDLFAGASLWPSTALGGIDWGWIYQRLFWLLILPAAAARIALNALPMLRFETQSLREWLLFAPLLGLMATVFLTLGEVRYRIPFDGLFIILAAHSYVQLARALRNPRHSALAR